jgi:glycosyltransferase involved in cell wall biosynthesis
MNAELELTIAIPTYNRQQCLSELLPGLVAQCQSVNAQRTRVEIVVVDNASTDSTSEYVVGQHSQDVRYFRNETNVGGDANFIECLRVSLGRYVWLFGDDEILNEAAISTLLELLRQNPALIIAGSDFSETRSFHDYAALLRYALSFDPIFPVHHTLITANIFPRKSFDMEVAKARISTSYGHMYAISEHLGTGKGILLLGKHESLFRIRDVRADFHWIPIKLEAKLLALCTQISRLTGIKRLRYNVWLFYRARRIYKLVHSKKVRRLLSFLRRSQR